MFIIRTISTLNDMATSNALLTARSVLNSRQYRGDADERQYFGGLSQEELNRRRQAARVKHKTLQASAREIGSEVMATEVYDEHTGQFHTVTRDELILRNFANKLIRHPTPQGLLAWQKIKGEDIVRIAPADRLDDKTADELKNELRGVLTALNNLPTKSKTGNAAPPDTTTQGNNNKNGGGTDSNPNDQDKTGSSSSNTAVDVETGERIEVSEVADNKPSRPPLPWLLR